MVARIEHRRPAGTHGPPSPSLGTLPVVAIAFLVLGALTAVIELWSVAVAWWQGVTEWWSAAPSLVSQAARSAAMVALPAAVAWGSPGRHRANAWLWRGSVLVAVVQLLRYPAALAGSWAFEALAGVGDDGFEVQFLLTSLALSLPLAVGSILGTWSLSEGLKDASGGSGGGVGAVAAVVTLAFGILVVVPPLMAGMVPDLNGAINLLSLGLTCLFVFVETLLAGRAVAGALGGARPRRPWAAGAIGAVVVFVLPLVTYATLLVNQLGTPGEPPLVVPFLGAASLLGWPLFGVALAAGMGRVSASTTRGRSAGFVLRGTPRVERVGEVPQGA